MKKLLSMLFAVAVLNGASSTVWSGHLTDFTESGFKFTQKMPTGIIEIDLTAELTKGSYSSYDPQVQSFVLKNLIIPKEFFDISKSKIQGVIDELKRRGQGGEIALPVFSNKRLLTNAIGVIFKPEFDPTLLIETLRKNYHVVIEAAAINGENGCVITLTLESNLNPLELCSRLTMNDGVRTCAPMMLCAGKKLYLVPEELPKSGVNKLRPKPQF